MKTQPVRTRLLTPKQIKEFAEIKKYLESEGEDYSDSAALRYAVTVARKWMGVEGAEADQE